MNDIAIFGAGGFGREVACLIKRINKIKPTWNFIGFFDDDQKLWGQENEYGKVLGGTEALNVWAEPLALAVGIGSPKAVSTVIASLSNPNLNYPNLFDPTVIILDEDNYKLGKGNIFAANCIISIAVRVGDFNTFNNNVVLGHDSVVGSFNSFMPNVNISGGVTIGNRNFFGVKSSVLQYLKIGDDTTIGGNAFVIRSTKNGFLYIGNPAKRMEL